MEQTPQTWLPQQATACLVGPLKCLGGRMHWAAGEGGRWRHCPRAALDPTAGWHTSAQQTPRSNPAPHLPERGWMRPAWCVEKKEGAVRVPLRASPHKCEWCRHKPRRGHSAPAPPAHALQLPWREALGRPAGLEVAQRQAGAPLPTMPRKRKPQGCARVRPTYTPALLPEERRKPGRYAQETRRVLCLGSPGAPSFPPVREVCCVWPGSQCRVHVRRPQPPSAQTSNGRQLQL